MSAIRKDSIYAIINRAYTLLDSKTHENIHEKFEFQQKIIHDEETLTKDEKSRAIKILTKYYDRNKSFI